MPDYLAISFSSTDYVGHLFGASSLEMEDNLLRLDHTLAELFTVLESEVGLKHTLIVLSADHGGPEVPGYLQSLGQPAEYVDRQAYGVEALNSLLQEALGVQHNLVREFFTPYVYLDRVQLAQSGLALADVQRALAGALVKRQDVFAAYAAADISHGLLPAGPAAEFVAASFHPERSGDVHVVFASQRFINDFDGLSVAATHGSVWRYDRHVPIIFAGNRLKGRRSGRPVTPYDIAATLSGKLRIPAPSGAVGEPLGEVID